MCGIAGFLNPGNNHQKTEKEKYEILRKMNEAQHHRGPDDEGIFLENGCALGHVRLSILDLYRGHQPMCKKKEGNTYAIILNGEIYNMKPLKEQLIKEGEVFATTSDTEVVLIGYIKYGISYIKQLNGIFAIALWDGKKQKVYLIRDRVGVKPLFYTKQGETLIFASEIKGLFAYPGVKPVINREGLCEIFGLGPAKSYGKGVFKDIYEVLPGHFLEYDREGLKDHAYWELKAKEHTDSEKDTIEHTRWLVKDAVEMQMLSDIPIRRGGECTMEKLYYTAKEVAEMLDVSVSHAYKVIREANRELSSKGFYVRAGRVSRKYLDSKVYDLCDKTA